MATRPTVILDPSINYHRPFVVGPGADFPDPTGHPEGYTASSTPPASPVIGDHWTNTSTSPVSGVPAGFTGRWNGSVWEPERIPAWTSATTPPTAPATNDYWLNTSSSTVSGVPGGAYAVWDGAAWRTGTVIEGYTQSSTAPTSPVIGDHWKNLSAGSVSGVPPGFTARWTGVAWDYTPPAAATQYGVVQLSNSSEWAADHASNNDVDAATPKHVKDAIAASNETYVAQATAPTDPRVGDYWLNNSTGTVSGLPAGKVGRWTGTFWDFVADIVFSSNAQSIAGTDTTTAMTPASTRASYVPIAGGTYTGAVHVSDGNQYVTLRENGSLELFSSGYCYMNFKADSGATDYQRRFYTNGLLFGLASPTVTFFQFNNSGGLWIGGSEGTAGQVLTSQGPSAAPVWSSPPGPTVSPGSVV